jgi:hypothetical protein
MLENIQTIRLVVKENIVSLMDNLMKDICKMVKQMDSENLFIIIVATLIKDIILVIKEMVLENIAGIMEHIIKEIR